MSLNGERLCKCSSRAHFRPRDNFVLGGWSNLRRILHIFAVDLDTDVVQVDLLNAEIPRRGVLGEDVLVSGGILEEGILPDRPRIVS